MYQIEKAISETAGVSIEHLTSKNHLKKPSIARGYLYLYLHKEMNMSISKISKAYDRNRRGVQKLIAKTKYSIENFNDANLEYKGIKKAVDKFIPTASESWLKTPKKYAYDNHRE